MHIPAPWSKSGIPEGSWVALYGTRQTVRDAVLAFAATAQQERYGSRPVYFAQAGPLLGADQLKRVKGLDLSPGKFQVKKPTQEWILSGKGFLATLEKVIKTMPNAVIILEPIYHLEEDPHFEEFLGIDLGRCIVVGLDPERVEGSAWAKRTDEHHFTL